LEPISVAFRLLSIVCGLLRASGLLAGVLGATCLPTYAQTNWTGATSTDWFTVSNWNTGVVPTAGDRVNLNTVTPNPTVVSGGAAIADILEIGLSATGSLTIQNNGTLTITGADIGNDVGSQGTATITGAGSIWTNSNLLSIGTNGTGALTIANGGVVSNTNGFIAFATGSQGTVTVTGTGSTWTNSIALFVGRFGTGTLTIADGSTVSVVGGSGTAFVADQVGSTGNLNIGAAPGNVATAPGTLSAATVAFGAGSGALNFNHTASNYVFAPTVTGNGTVNVFSGTTFLTANNSYTGSTAVNAGTLVVNGSIASSNLISVNNGGTLAGTGTVGNTQVNAGGTFAPGSGVPASSMTVSGNLAFASGAQYLVQLNPATASFTNVSGTTTLGGAAVNATYANGSYVSKQYTIVNATGGVNGTFGSLVNTNLPANFTPGLSYDATHAFLNLTLNFTPPPPLGPPNFGGGLTVNQANVANALINFFNANGGIPLVFGTLTPAGLTQASGEVATGSQQTTFDAMNLFLGLLTDPFVAGRGDPVSAGASMGASAYTSQDKPRSGAERDAYAAIYRKAPAIADPFTQRWSVWAAGYGGSQTTDGNASLGSNNTTSGIAGGVVGADYRFSPFTLAGFALAGGGTNFNVANGLGSGRSDLFQAGAFIRHTVGPAYLTGALAYGWQDITTDRTVTIAGVDQLRAQFNANAWSGRVEGGYRFVSPWIGMGITPYAAGQFTTFDLPAYAEQAVVGTNTFALAYGSKSVTASRSELGLRSDKSFAMQDGIFTLRGRAAWAYDFNTDRVVGATFQTLPGASFVVNGAAQAHDAALVTASAEWKWLNGWSAAATFEGEFSSVTTSYAGKGVVRYSW
jgi:T5SS/PEP-CTERM-associated repeat protein/autotransporter-associated beta strand protein